MTEKSQQPYIYGNSSDKKHLRDVEASQIAADMSRIGSLAIATEVATEVQTGVESRGGGDLKGIIAEKQLEPRKYYASDDISSRETVTQPDAVLTALNSELTEEREELDAMAAGELGEQELRTYFADKVANARRALNRPGLQGTLRQEEQLNALDLPPYLRMVKDSNQYETTNGRVTERGEGSWDGFFQTASESQIANFSQWYASELRRVATPEARETETARIKAEYLGGIDRLIAEGALSSVVRKTIAKRLEKIDIFFRSPFQEADNLGEYNPGGRFLIVTLGSGNKTTFHEISHGIGGIDVKGLTEAARQISEEGILSEESLAPAVITIRNMLDEAAVSHMSQMIDGGDPKMIDPSVRLGNGENAHTQSRDYTEYLKTLSLLLEGERGVGIVNTQTISEFYTALIAGKYEDVSTLIDRQWGEEGILKEAIRKIASRLEDNEDGASVAELMQEIRSWLGEKQQKLAYAQTPLEEKAA